MKLGMQVCFGPGHIVLDGDPAPPPPKWHSIKMPLGTDVDLSPEDFVLDGDHGYKISYNHDGDPVPLPKKGAEPPKFSAHVYCGQTAGWIKMPLGTKVGLSPGDSVLDGAGSPSNTMWVAWTEAYFHRRRCCSSAAT